MINKLNYTHELVGLTPDIAHFDDQVMVGKMMFGSKYLSLPKYKKGTDIVTGTVKTLCKVGEDYGAQSLVDEDLFIGKVKTQPFESIPYKGGYIIDYGDTQYWTRKAKPREFSSIHAYLTREGDTIFNHSFIEKQLWSDFLIAENMVNWRMPFSPESVSKFAISWQMIDSEGFKWECVPPAQQKPDNIVRLKYYYLNEPEAVSVNVKMGDTVGYDVATHTFNITAGCKIRMFFINSPLGMKEWSTEIDFNLDTNQNIFI